MRLRLKFYNNWVVKLWGKSQRLSKIKSYIVKNKQKKQSKMYEKKSTFHRNNIVKWREMVKFQKNKMRWKKKNKFKFYIKNNIKLWENKCKMLKKKSENLGIS